MLGCFPLGSWGKYWLFLVGESIFLFVTFFHHGGEAAWSSFLEALTSSFHPQRIWFSVWEEGRARNVGDRRNEKTVFRTIPWLVQVTLFRCLSYLPHSDEHLQKFMIDSLDCCQSLNIIYLGNHILNPEGHY